MAGSLEPHPGTPAGRPQGPAVPASQGPQGLIHYQAKGPVGFERLPAEIRSALAGALPGPRFAAGADRDPVVKRRPDGSCYQFQAGWWLAMPPSGGGRLVQVEARRELAPVGQKSWVPAGAWRASGRVLVLAPARPRESSWHPRPGTGTGEGNAAPVTAHHPSEILPPEVWGPVDSAQWSAWLTTFPNGSVEETVVAALASDERVRALAATRAAPSDAARASAAWHVRTLEAVVVGIESLTGKPLPAPGRRPSVGPGPGSAALPR